MVKHHVSYRKNVGVELTPREHFFGHFGFGKCSMCGKKGKNKRYFAPVDPKTGEGYNDTFIHPNTGSVNHPWPSNGRWILICDECKPKAIGVRIASEDWR